MRAELLKAMCIAAVAASLAGCETPGATPQMLAPQVRADRNGTWMLPAATKTKRLLYLSDAGADVYVYDYDDFKEIGTLTGFIDPAGQCVDANGDVWITEQTNGEQGGGEAVEYAHGGTTVLGKVTTDQPPAGCSISTSGYLEVTEGGILTSSGILGPGEIQIWKSTSKKPSDFGANSSCYLLNSGGYDNRGNLYVTGTSENSESSSVCLLPAGSKKLKPASVDQSLSDPVGIMWDGKYMAITNVGYSSGDNYATTILQAKETSTGALRIVGNGTSLNDNCDGNQVDISPAPFIAGRKNTPVNTTQGTSIAGFNFICGINPIHFRAWAYPKGGNPLREIDPKDGAGAAVSIAP